MVNKVKADAIKNIESGKDQAKGNINLKYDDFYKLTNNTCAMYELLQLNRNIYEYCEKK